MKMPNILRPISKIEVSEVIIIAGITVINIGEEYRKWRGRGGRIHIDHYKEEVQIEEMRVLEEMCIAFFNLLYSTFLLVIQMS